MSSQDKKVLALVDEYANHERGSIESGAMIESYTGWLESQLVIEREKHRWIPVTDRLPENDTDVLVSLAPYKTDRTYRQKTIALFDEPKKLWFDERCNVVSVTHWMPLPSPPQEGK